VEVWGEFFHTKKGSIVRVKGVLKFLCLERSKGEEAWGEKVEGIIK